MNPFIKTIQDSLAFAQIPCWLMYSEEHSDSFFERHITKDTSVPTIFMVTPNDSVLIVHPLEISNVFPTCAERILPFESRDHLWTVVEEVLAKHSFPSRIALSYSTMGDVSVDLVGHGLFLLIESRLKAIYVRAEEKLELCSAEGLIYATTERRSDDELLKMRLAARRAHELLEQAFKEITPGLSEREIMLMVQDRMKTKPNYFSEQGVAEEGLAWNPAGCPVVLAGPNLLLGGHTNPGDFRLERGHTLFFDFGVQLKFNDGTKWSSDIQRMGYVLRDGETSVPPAVQKVFDTLVAAIDKGIAALIPGRRGYEIDEIVRGHVTSNGYPSYNHATGHAIGELPHNPGAVLGAKKSPRSQLLLQPNAVYTIEPRVAINNGGSIEEMVVARARGGEAISPRQTSLYLIS